MEETFPRLLLRNNERWGDTKVALRKKEYGIWREYSWADCYARVKATYLGLSVLGLRAGDIVSILSDSNPEWFWSELAVQTARAIVTGLNPGGSAEETKGLLLLTQAKFVLAQDQEQVDKLLEVKSGLGSVQKIVYWNEKGLRHYQNPILISLDEVIRLGEEHERAHPGDFERKLSHGRDHDVAIIIFGLGVNGSLKVVHATHRFLLSSLETILASNPVCDTDDYVSVIMPGWFFEQTLGFAATLLAGQRLNFVERADTAPEDMREISPSMLVYPSDVWEEIAEAIQTNVRAGTRMKRKLFNYSLSVGYESAGGPAAVDRRRIVDGLRRSIAEYTVFRPLRDKHGLNKSRVVYTAGSELSPETTRFFRAIGVNMKQVFGSTRDGVVSVPPEEGFRLE